MTPYTLKRHFPKQLARPPLTPADFPICSGKAQFLACGIIWGHGLSHQQKYFLLLVFFPDHIKCEVREGVSKALHPRRPLGYVQDCAQGKQHPLRPWLW